MYSIIGLTIGCLISFFIVIGDLAPPIVAISLGVDWVSKGLKSIRTTSIVVLLLCSCPENLPISLVTSLSADVFNDIFGTDCLTPSLFTS